MKTPPTDICSNYWKSQVQVQNRLAKPAQHCLQRTVCYAPFKGLFSLENMVPFRGLVLVATRR
jgi:hypothetical protein